MNSGKRLTAFFNRLPKQVQTQHTVFITSFLHLAKRLTRHFFIAGKINQIQHPTMKGQYSFL